MFTYGNINRTNKIDINSSVVYRLTKVSNSFSFTSSICRRGKHKTGARKHGVKNRSKFQRIVDKLINCGSPNQQLLTLKEVLLNPNLMQTNEHISSSTSNSSSNTLNYFSCFFILKINVRQVHLEHGVPLYSKQVYMIRLIQMYFVKVIKGKSQSHVLCTA